MLGDALDRRLWRLDARTGRIEATIPLGFPPTSVAVADGTAWITDGLHDRVVPVDAPQQPRAAAGARSARGASGVAAGAGGVWVANTIAGTVSRIDPRTRAGRGDDRRRRPAPRRSRPASGAVWVTEYAG